MRVGPRSGRFRTANAPRPEAGRRVIRWPAVVLSVSLLAAACSSDSGAPAPDAGSDGGASTSTSTSSSALATTTTSGPPPPSGIYEVGEGGVELLSAPGGSVVGRIRAGVLLPYSETTGSAGAEFVRVTTPCDNRAWAAADAGRRSGAYRVAIDPGHGGDEPGAAGPGGLTEKEVNLGVAREVVEQLGAVGIPAVLTRASDYRATLKFRVEVAREAGAEVFVSVHHNAEPDEQRATPGTEAYFQIRSDESKRLTGLVYEEVFGALAAHDISFAADFDAGAKFRLSSSGDDYYGIVRRSYEAGMVGTLLEAGFISNPEEERLLGSAEVRRAEAAAIARAIQRYFAGERPGDVFTDPYPRTTPAGSGGGASGCADPS